MNQSCAAKAKDLFNFPGLEPQKGLMKHRLVGQLTRFKQRHDIRELDIQDEKLIKMCERI